MGGRLVRLGCFFGLRVLLLEAFLGHGRLKADLSHVQKVLFVEVLLRLSLGNCVGLARVDGRYVFVDLRLLSGRFRGRLRLLGRRKLFGFLIGLFLLSSKIGGVLLVALIEVVVLLVLLEVLWLRDLRF